MEYQILWFILWGILWAVYFMSDGFDLGVGMLHHYLAENDDEKRIIINAIGPVWDGNEVWLVTAGGATFAAFPTTYALMFSYLYTPLLIILFALIFRGVAFEFRGKEEGQGWKKGWDAAIFFGSFIPALLFGVAFGNIFRGLPMDGAGYHGNLFILLNMYALLTGMLFVLLFLLHGSLWLAFKTEGGIAERAVRFASKSWSVMLLVLILFLVYTAFATHLYDNFIKNPIWLVILLIVVAAVITTRFFLSRGRYLGSFVSNGLAIFFTVITGVIGLYPNLIPSSIDPAYSLTAFNSSSSPYTLKIMTVVALLFVPIVIAYQLWVYRIFRHKVTVADIADNKEAY